MACYDDQVACDDQVAKIYGSLANFYEPSQRAAGWAADLSCLEVGAA